MLMLDIIADGLRTLFAFLCKYIYELIAILYDLFINISRVEILSNSQIQPIYQRVTLILTIVMVFYVTFEMVKFVVQPDQFSDKEKGASKIVLRMVLVVILIAFVPKIFGWAYDLQNKIFDTQIISKVILGNPNVDADSFGKNISYNMFGMFYDVNEEFSTKELEEKDNCAKMPCKQVVTINLYQLQKEGKLPLIYNGLNDTGKIKEPTTGDKVEAYYIEFNGFLAVLVGGFMAYMLLLYCIDVGVRVVQMVYLQIIAPIPIMAYLAPKKDGIFEKWVKQCTTTYLDIFIRVAIIYFVLLICEILSTAFADGTLINNVTGGLGWAVYVALVLGLLLFAKKAPDMLKELFPSSSKASGNFGLKAGERVAPLAARAIGAGLGATRAVGGAIARAHNRHIRNKANDQESFLTKKGRKQAKDRADNRTERNERKQAQKRAERIDEQKRNASEKLKKAVAERDKIKEKKEKAGIDYKNDKEWQDADKKVKDMAKKETAKLDKIRKEDAAYKAKREASEAKRNELFKELGIKPVNDPNLTAEQKQAIARENREKIRKYQEEKQKEKNEITSELDKLNKKENEGTLTSEEATKKAELEEKANKYNTLEEMQQGASATTTKMQEIANVEDAKVKAEKAQEQVIEDQNTKYRSVAGAGLWGALAGGATGAYYGSKATKLEEIIPKVKEGVKHDVENIHAVDKYYDNGGTGLVDRIVTQAEKKIGMDTEYVATNLQTQALESQIKKYDSTISVADNAKKSFDATEDRLKSKLPESKFVVGEEGDSIDTGLFEKNPDGSVKVGADGKPIKIKRQLAKGERIADVVRESKATAATAKATADQTAKELQDIKTRHGSSKIQRFDDYSNGILVGSLTATEQTEYNEYIEAKKVAERKSKEAADLEFSTTQIEKNAARYIFTQMLQGKVSADQVDAVAKENLDTQLNDVKIAAQDPEISKYIRDNKPQLYQAFINCRFKDYDQLDATISAITAAKNIQIRYKQEKQAQVSRNNTSSTTQAQKAANDYNGGSGK